ncbi:MAG TPA: CHASE domain-containing protein [Sphingobacteriaceae bacterium]
MEFTKFLKTYYPAVLILIILCSFSLYAFYEATVSASARRSRVFTLRVAEVTRTINTRIADYIQILRGCQSLFYSADTVTSEEWRAYTRNLMLTSNYPGIEAIAYCTFISRNEISELEDKMKKSGYPEFTVKSSLKNDYLTPIIYIEPFKDRNLRAFGFDMYGEDIRRKAMDRAIATGEAAMSRKVTLVQEGTSNVQPGFLLYLPVYDERMPAGDPADRRKHLKGFVYNAFRSYDLMRSILSEFEDIEVELYDGAVDPKNLLYATDPGRPENDREFKTDTTFMVAGTPWRVSVLSAKSFGSSIERNQPVLILVFGLAITGLIFIMAVNVIRRRAEAVEELTFTKRIEAKKDEFIGIASHELKTPLTSIKAYVQLLQRSPLQPAEKNYVNKAASNVDKLNQLISDLLDVTKIQAGRLQISKKPFLLKDLINESVENVQHMFNSHQIIKPERIPDVTINGDKLRLEQAITNFLVNAIKYSPGADKVFLNATPGKEYIQIEIKDLGIGISKEDQEQIFDRFYRVDELSPVISGLGMGLYITHEIIKRHRGDIGVISEPGKGSTFFFRLPLH